MKIPVTPLKVKQRWEFEDNVTLQWRLLIENDSLVSSSMTFEIL